MHERILLGGRELVLERPDDPESLIDECRFGTDEFLPYWAELWPSGLALARHVARLDVRGKRVLELGCGLALPSFAAALGGADVLATDWAPEAVELARRNAAANGLRLTAAVFDWSRAPAPPGAPFDVVLAADVLYEERNAPAVLAALGASVGAGGEARIADPGRRHAEPFLTAAGAAGWTVETIADEALPAGSILALRRPQPRPLQRCGGSASS